MSRPAPARGRRPIEQGIRLLDAFRRPLDDVCDRFGIRHVDRVTSLHFDHSRSGTLRRRALCGRRNRPVLDGHEVPAALALPGWIGDRASEREVEVLRCVARGAANKQVAIQLLISEETVKVLKKHVVENLAATDRKHAVTIALSRGIIDL